MGVMLENRKENLIIRVKLSDLHDDIEFVFGPIVEYFSEYHASRDGDLKNY